MYQMMVSLFLLLHSSKGYLWAYRLCSSYGPFSCPAPKDILSINRVNSLRDNDNYTDIILI